MKNYVSKLLKLMQPPKSPRANIGKWEPVEKKLGTPLPQDYRDYIEAYGTGHISGFAYVYSPFSSNVASNLIHANQGDVSTLSTLRRHRDEGTRIDWPLYPEPEGLLNWGMTDNGDEFFWTTAGKPDKWEVVFFDRGGGGFQKIPKCSFSKFLYLELTETGEKQPFQSENFDEPIFTQFSTD